MDIKVKKDWQISICVFLLAIGVRLFYLYESSANPSFDAPIVDSGTYDSLARMVAEGKGMNGEFFWQSFFYPSFLSIIYLASNSSIICAKIIQALLGCITCLLAYQLGKRIFNRGTGIIAGVMTALYGPLIFFESELLASGWAAFWSVALVLLFLKASSEKKMWLCVALGVCGALSILTHPTFLPFFTASAAWLAIALYRSEKRWRQPALELGGVIGGFLLIVIPASVQNFRLTGHFGFLPASGGINLFIGNNLNYTELLLARPGWGWEEVTSTPERAGVIGDMWEDQKYFNEKVINFVLTEPFAFAKGLVHKTIQFLNPRELPRNVDIYLFSKWSRLLGLLAWKAGGFGFPFGVLLPLGLLGLVSYWRQIPVPLKLFLIFYPLSIILVFIASRYRVAMVPVMSVTAAAGLLSLIRMIRGLYWHRIVIVGICCAGIVLLSTVPGPFPEEQVNFEAELYANVASTEMARGQIQTAINHLNKALSLQSDYPSAHANLGMALTDIGKINEAITHYKIALDFKDDSPEVHNNLATALADIGEIEQAFIHYNKAIDIRPYYAEAHYNLGNLLLATGKLEDAIEHLNKALQIKKDYFKAHNSLAVALASQGKPDEALAHFAEAVRLQPNDYNAHYNLARALADYGKTEEAIKEFTEVLKLNPEDLGTLSYLAQILATHDNPGIRNPSEAIRLAEKACDLTVYKRPELLDTLAQAYATAGRFAEAVTTTEKALELSLPSGNEGLIKNLQKSLKYYKDKIEERKSSPVEVKP
jgi:tetratricopeptide (TPR) repeat protein